MYGRLRFYAKRCLMSLLENMAKHVVVIKDSILDDILHFLDSCQCELCAS